MAFKFRCPGCGVQMVAIEDSIGRKTRCASCHLTFPIPDPDSASDRDSSDENEDRHDEDRDRPRYDEDSDYDEPRPRRRRRRPPPPPSSSGRGVLTILGILFGVFFLGSCMCCGGCYVAQPDPDWHTYSPPDAGYSAEFPLPPETDPDFSDEPGETTDGGVLVKKFEEYGVTYRDVERNGRTDEQIMDDFAQQQLVKRQLKIKNKKNITVSGYPGIEIEVSGDDGFYIGRVVLAEGRVYYALAGGPFAKSSSPNVRRFIDSFQITKEKKPPVKKF